MNERYIKSIKIFSKDGDLREVSFNKGVNIITGDSQTGKSAIIDIVDYCFLSQRCTIPKGVIYDFGYIYCVTIELNNKEVLIARKSPLYGGNVYIATSKELQNVSSITFEFINSQTFRPLIYAKESLLTIFGIEVYNIPIEEEKTKTTSVRSLTSFMFQHQNLIANKYAIFYRFSDYYKRKDTIEQFPVLLGIADSKYYSKLSELEMLKNKLKRLKRDSLNITPLTQSIESEIQKCILENYFLLGYKDKSDIRIEQVDEILKEFDNEMENSDLNVISSLDGEILENYQDMRKKLREKEDDYFKVSLKMDSLMEASKTGNDYVKKIKDSVSINKVAIEQLSEREQENYYCPICGCQMPERIVQTSIVQNALDWAQSEIEITSGQLHDFSTDLQKLNNLKNLLEEEISTLRSDISYYQEKYLKSSTDDGMKTSFESNVKTAKGLLKTLKIISDPHIDDEISKLQDQVKIINEEIEGYSIKTKLGSIERSINSNMSRIANLLDFEDDLKPIDLHFGLIDKSYDVYNEKKDTSRVFLSEMGSGANWVTVHISLFLSLLRQFATLDNSKNMISMIFDQPSQVYFPNSNIDDGKEYIIDRIEQNVDIYAVNKIYKTIFEEVKEIEKQTGTTPQVIILDHVLGDQLECSEEFNNYVVKNFRNGQKLI